VPSSPSSSPRPCPRRKTVLQLACLAALALGACREPKPIELRQRVPLSALAPSARFWSPTGELMIGSEAAEELLLGGWSTAEPDGAWRWSTGLRSDLWWDAVDDGPRRLGFEAWAFEGSAAEAPQQVTVSVNGRAVGTVALDTVPAEHRVEIPVGSLRHGRNHLTLDHAASAPAPDGDPRSLSAGWRRMWLEDEHGRPLASSRIGELDGDRLLLPARSGVELFFESSGRRWLVLDAVEARTLDGSAAPPAWLEVTVERAAGDAADSRRDRSESATVRPGERGFRLEIPEGGGPVQLTLVAVAESGVAVDLHLVGAALATDEIATEQSAAGQAPEQPAGTVASRRRPETGPARPNVLIYLVDTLRADRLGCYGHTRATSPRLDAFAAEAVLFERATAQSSWTRPATATVLTGLDPLVHGVHRRADRLPDDVVTLPERLRVLGYDTAAWVTNGNVAAPFGFRQGFETFHYLPEQRGKRRHRRSRQLTELAGAWLEERVARGETRPFFLYLHTTDPHAPYVPAPAFRDRFVDRPLEPRIGTLGHLRALEAGRPADPREVADLQALYDAEVAFNDQWFGVLLDRLAQLGLDRDTLVVFLSDHGEEFGEHGGWQHGRTLYQEQLHVPLLIHLPGGALGGTRRAELVQQADVVPTVLEAIGAPPAEGLQGRALFRREPSGGWVADPGGGAAFAVLDLDGRRGEAVLAGDRKLLLHAPSAGARPRRVELFELGADPAERHDLTGAEPVWAGYLLARLGSRRWLWPAGAAAQEAVIDDQLRDELRALGYLQ
jgi:arylsulfatase A-like enzyme